MKMKNKIQQTKMMIDELINIHKTLRVLTESINDIQKSIKNVNNKINNKQQHELMQILNIKNEINKIKLSVMNINNNNKNDKVYLSEIENIKKWLANTVKLPQYIDNFTLNGYDSFDIISEITDKNELNEIGIELKGHQLKILKEILKLKDKIMCWECTVCDSKNKMNPSICHLCGFNRGEQLKQNDDKVEGVHISDTMQ